MSNETELKTAQDQERKERKSALRAAKVKACETLKELVDKQTDRKYQEALAVVRPSLYGLTGGGVSSGNAIHDQFAKFVAQKKTVSEDEVFKQYKIGRKEAHALLRKHLKKATPAERQWISFDKTKGSYTLAGTGEKPPKGYEGYVPAEESVDVGAIR